MICRIKISNACVFALILTAALPVAAHKTELAGNVAGTWHIDPNDSPKAGEPAQVWVALTRQGGTIIPLEQCDCQLKIWAEPRKSDLPLLEPSLKAITAEQYQGIPGAEVVFPQPGQYQLQLSGAPKPGADFQPFEFNHTVIVATGAVAASPTVNPSPDVAQTEPTQATPTTNTTTNWQLSVAILGTMVVLVGLWLAMQKGKRNEE